MDIHSALVRRAAEEFVDFVNEYNARYTNLCEKLQLLDIHEAARLMPNRRVLSFKGSIDADGLKPDLTNKATLSSEVIQVKVATKPGTAIFEFSSIHDIANDRFVFQVSVSGAVKLHFAHLPVEIDAFCSYRLPT